jgi:hypothetical protein
MIMRALSLTQPWANLVAQGRKSIETRTWATLFRGRLLICATRQRVPDCPGPYGVALAVARLCLVRPMVAGDEPAACCKVYPGALAWVLDPVRALPPEARFPVHGQLGLFFTSIPPVREDLVCGLIGEPRPAPVDLNAIVGFFDVQCGRCGRRFGWSGRASDRPPCPGCGGLPEPRKAVKGA